MKNPLVSIIVLSYNHARFVEEAVQSVLNQDYSEIEIIAIDDYSKDNSAEILHDLSVRHSFLFIRNTENLGNCGAFNRALKNARGKYVIDLSADDFLMPERVSLGVKALENLPAEFGVHFCDVEIIDEEGKFVKTHYKRDKNGRLLEDVPQGWIFKDLLERYFISTPTMMMKKQVFDDLNGYDENLSYEDFDFWIRSSKKYRYVFEDSVLVKKRIVRKSHSQTQRKILNRHVTSTRIVCEKAFDLCENGAEYGALLKRIGYEIKWALATGNFREVIKYQLLKAKAKKQQNKLENGF